MKPASRGSVLVRAALVRLGVVLAVLLERVDALLPVARVAGGRAELLHLVPRRRALGAHRVIRARLLGLLDALGHLVGEIRRRGRRAGRHGHQPAVRAHRPDEERHDVLSGRLREASWCRENGECGRGGDRGGHGLTSVYSGDWQGVVMERREKALVVFYEVFPLIPFLPIVW